MSERKNSYTCANEHFRPQEEATMHRVAQ
jgi:hypothetical protein